jgi:phage gp29-like protein
VGVFARIGQRLTQAFSRTPDVRVVVGSRAPRDVSRWPQWLAAGLTPARLAAILRSADQGYTVDYFTLLQEVAQEAVISGALRARLSALSQRPVKTIASKADPDAKRAEEVAAFGQEVLEGLRLARPEAEGVRLEKGLAGLIEGLTMAGYYGVACGHVSWRVPRGMPRARPAFVELFDERRLTIDIQTESIYVDAAGARHRGIALSSFDPANIIEVRHTWLSRRLSMAGAGRACLLPWWLRHGSFKELFNYAETWSRPVIIGSSSEKTSGAYNEDALSTFKHFLEDMVGDTRVLLPPGFAVDTLQAMAGGELLFESIDGLTERHILYALTGQTGAGAGDKTTMASAEVDERIRGDVTEGDARMVGEALENLLTHAVAVEFGCDVPAPTVEFESAVTVEDRQTRANMLLSAATAYETLTRAGFVIDQAAYAEDFDIPIAEATEIDSGETLAPAPTIEQGDVAEAQDGLTP